MSRDTWELLGPSFDGVGCVTLSFEVGAVKPEPEIYLRCLSALGVSPEEALFVDDRAVNIEGARALGMHAVLFEGEDALAAEVAGLGLGWPLP
jgi:putative hydrolase of the HAD superfamily